VSQRVGTILMSR